MANCAAHMSLPRAYRCAPPAALQPPAAQGARPSTPAYSPSLSSDEAEDTSSVSTAASLPPAYCVRVCLSCVDTHTWWHVLQAAAVGWPQRPNLWPDYCHMAICPPLTTATTVCCRRDTRLSWIRTECRFLPSVRISARACLVCQLTLRPPCVPAKA
jgi:hypothetical protein